MTAAPITAASAANTTALGKANLAENFDTFLTLLTTQLKNQDPLSPLDSNQFTQQMVSMTGVQQQLLTNDLLQKLVGNTGSNMATAVSLIGKQAKATSDGANLANGKADWTVNLANKADVKFEVIDAAGRVVHAESASGLAAGDHAFSWDGKDAGGAEQPDGSYTLKVTATDSTGAAVTSTTSIQGVVTGIEQVNGETMINVNGEQVPWGNVTTVNQVVAAQASNGAGATP